MVEDSLALRNRVSWDETSENPSSSESSEPVEPRVARSRKQESTEADKKKRTKKKPTYLVRKEEVDLLREEARTLQETVTRLRIERGLPTEREMRSLELAQNENDILREKIRKKSLSTGRLRSLVTKHTNHLRPRPMETFIHLGCDLAARRATLVSLRETIFQHGQEYLQERFRHQDEQAEYQVTERYEDPEGNRHSDISDIVHFEGVQSVKQVYDALVYYLSNMELTVSEQLGNLTLREDIDAIDTRISNHRFVSRSDHGIATETNTVFCTQYWENHEQHDVVATLSLRSFHTEDDLVVVMKRCASLTLHQPRFKVDRVALKDMHEKMGNWGVVMVNSLRGALYRR
ncbi:hypothetical protein Poli38472_012375 [Pythium oligandrum]|uniref:Uncharacterized protein n=1 Tax=Pythium oligandrum TaxID=41045 RepID=A0A8K1FNF2_PYTOL|nr:hypothetical protein Poli38472_012375 [Pythium oligandrum]|eukprot:TMW67259.1 hypothetical protein Poli38472_012375 [Pythium oligandrum]